MIGNLITEFIDSNFLVRETSELTKIHNALKREIGNKKIVISDLEQTISELDSKINSLSFTYRNLTCEIESLSSIKDSVISHNQIIEKYKEKILEIECEISRLENNRETSNNELTQVREVYNSKLELIEIELEDFRQKRLNAIKDELSKQRESELSSLNSELSSLNSQLEAKKVEISEKLKSLDLQALEEIKVIKVNIQEWENKFLETKAKQKKLEESIVSKAFEEIESQKKKARLDLEEERLRIEDIRQQTQEKLNNDKLRIVEQFKPQIIEPYLKEIERLSEEIIRLNKVQASNSKKDYLWSLDQIKNAITRVRNGKLEPMHIRIAGESESGKSHLINQLISQGLKCFGINANFELFDPFPSDTEWKISPTIEDNPDEVMGRFNYWKEFIESGDSKKLDNPLIIVCDESDEMIRAYKSEFVDCIKAIWKRGRHMNIFLWLLGQNGNVKHYKNLLDWGDLRNATGIYLNNISYEYLKNGVPNRDTRVLLGEVEHIASITPYFAVIHPKQGSIYGVKIPYALFPETSSKTSFETSSSKPISLTCGNPECNSKNVKRNGFIKGKQRVLCHDCGKQSDAQ